MAANKKHPCPDCHFCQFCSDTRCNACRRACSGRARRSLREQIELYNRLNPGVHNPHEPIYYQPDPAPKKDRS